MAKPKTKFATLLRDTRVQTGYTRRRFAEIVGLSMRTIDNAEYSGHRVLGAAAVDRIADAAKLEPETRAALHEANAQLGESAYMVEQKQKWDGARSHRKQQKAIRFALVLMLEQAAHDGRACECGPDLRICDLCAGLRALELGEEWKPEAAAVSLAPIADDARTLFDSERTRFDLSDVTTTQVDEDDFGGA